MPTITTNTGTKTSTVVWTAKEIDLLDWARRHNLIPLKTAEGVPITTLVHVAEFVLLAKFKNLKEQYFTEIARLRQEAHDAATPANQATADAAIGFDPEA